MKRVSSRQLNKYAVAALVLSVILSLSSVLLLLSVTGARYVTEVKGDKNLPFETQTPFDVDSQSALVNACQSGYGYVKLSSDLTGPLIMTGDTLDLVRDLTIDLNGKEIQRTNSESLITVKAGTSLNIIDTAGGGGLYNPVGSALTVDGGDLNVYGGTFESGPRPEEYYTKIREQLGTSQLSLVSRKVVTMKDRTVGGQTITVGSTDTRMILPIRDGRFTSKFTGNIYFDVDSNSYEGDETLQNTSIAKDTYCYTVIKGETNDEFATFDTSSASFAYSYYVDMNSTLNNASGYGRYVGYVNDKGEFMKYTGSANANEDANAYTPSAIEPTYREVMVFGFENDIAKSALTSRGGVASVAPQYAAVKMLDGTLNIEVTGSQEKNARKAGSFYSYFGTWQTYCVYINGGVMNVNTTGEMSTVDPKELPLLTDDELTEKAEDGGYKAAGNTAKFSEGACIFSEAKKLAGSDKYSLGGRLNITGLSQATSYNGSVISVSGGDVTMSQANITKWMSYSHFDNPFQSDEASDSADRGSQFPADRQYRDAAVFINGGSLLLQGSDLPDSARENNINIRVNKDFARDVLNLPPSTCHTSFGILSRGREGFNSKFKGNHVNVTMEGSHSYGVFGTRGDVELNHGDIVLLSDVASYGVYAVNRSSLNPVEIILNQTDVKIGNAYTYQGTSNDITAVTNSTYKSDWVDVGNGVEARPASIGVYLDSHIYGGASVTVSGAKIISQEMGVSVYGGNLTFQNGCDIEAYNASAITLRSAGDNASNIEFTKVNELNKDEPISTYKIKCYINRAGIENSTTCYSTNTVNPGLHQYEIFLPYQYNGTSASAYENRNGIRVAGGSLVSHGKLKMDFRGLYNDINQFNEDEENFRKVVIKSFAVACLAEGNAEGNITLDYAEIESAVGGGVKAQGGKIVLGRDVGTTGLSDKDVKVTTNGDMRSSTPLPGTGKVNASADTWKFYPGLSGGYAVIARGGSLTVNAGTYTAKYADAAAVTADDPGDPPTITINGGIFDGQLSNAVSGFCTGGPMSHYGLKVVGRSNVNINGGLFNGRNGGLAVMGTDASNKTTVKVSAGQFGDENAGQDGVNVFNYSNVYFGTNNDSTWVSEHSSDLKVYGQYFGIATNPISEDNNNINVYVYYGNYYMTEADTVGKWGTIKVGIGTIGTRSTTFRIYGVYSNTKVFGKKAEDTTFVESKEGNFDSGRYISDKSQLFLRNNTYSTDTTIFGTASKTNREFPYTDA